MLRSANGRSVRAGSCAATRAPQAKPAILNRKRQTRLSREDNGIHPLPRSGRRVHWEDECGGLDLTKRRSREIVPVEGECKQIKSIHTLVRRQRRVGRQLCYL